MCLLEIKRPQSMSIEVCICTFQVFLLGKHLKDYHTVSNEIMSLSGTIQKYQPKKDYQDKTKKICEFIADKTLLKVGS
jgi:hypothetical protein